MYTVDKKKKLISISAGTLTEKEQKEVDDYVKYSDYTLEVIQPTPKRKNNSAKIKEDNIIAIIKDDEEALKKYEEAKKAPSEKDPSKEKGFLGGKTWFIENYEDKYLEFLKETEQNNVVEAWERNRKKREEKKNKKNKKNKKK